MEKQIICNCCGKEIYSGTGIEFVEYLHVEKVWGYFSNRDGVRQEMNICEDCYEEWTSHFQIPVHTSHITEFV